MAGTGQDLAEKDEQAPVLYPGSTLDPADEPSAAWGWHGGFPRASLIAGWASVAALLSMLIGNHKGWVEDVWLVGIAAVMAFGLVRHSIKQRNAWRD